MIPRKTRIGAVSYLNTHPLVFGLERVQPADIELHYGTPSELADLTAAGGLDVALLPTIELSRIPNLEVITGLGIACDGPARSVLLVSRKPISETGTVSLDPESRTSNALAQVLFRTAWNMSPSFSYGPAGLSDALRVSDAVVRIGDKALFERPPAGTERIDLAEEWISWTGMPFVFAVWTCRPGVMNDRITGLLIDSFEQGIEAIDYIAARFCRRFGRQQEVAASYLRNNIRYRIGRPELKSIDRFLKEAAAIPLEGSHDD